MNSWLLPWASPHQLLLVRAEMELEEAAAGAAGVRTDCAVTGLGGRGSPVKPETATARGGGQQEGGQDSPQGAISRVAS